MAEEALKLQDWVGRQETVTDYSAISPVVRMSAMLDRDDPPPDNGDPLPPGWHWVYFNPAPLARDIQHDGHARLGGFWPPVGLPRRMFAGSRMTFHRPILLGEKIERVAEITSIKDKEGSNGLLRFVGVQLRISGSEGLAVTEDQTIVYRPDPRPGDKSAAPQAPPENPDWVRTIEPDPVLLFRFSALTFNGHRIHYDHPYVTEVEGYPGLVVQGPLLSTLLIDLLRRSLPAEALATFNFRAMRPVFATGPFQVAARRDGDAVTAWATDNDGHLAMMADGTLAA